MKNRDFNSDDLRTVFASPPVGASAAENCPAPEQIMRAVLGELSIAENRSIADHGAVCPSCTVAWKLARELAAESALQSHEAAPFTAGRGRRSAPGWRWIPAAAAAAAVLALLAVLVPWSKEGPAPEPVLRAVDRETIASELPEDARLPADRFTLRWSSGPEGARYDIRVTDRRLNQLARADSLDRPEYTVAAAALAELEPGSLVLWQVETVLPDGRRIVSVTFATRLE